MASTTSDTGDTSSKRQQAQCKENYNKSKRPVSSVDHCHPYRRKREEKQFTKPTHVAVYLFRDLDRDSGVDSKDDSGSQGQYREEKKRSKRENDTDCRILRNDRHECRTLQNNRHGKRELSHTRTYTGRV